MYILSSICSSSGVLRLFYILKLLLQIIFIVVPIIVIIMSIVDFSKVVISGKSDTMNSTLTQCAKRIIAGLIIFLIPTLMSTLFEYLVDMNFEFGTCVTNATLEGIKNAEQQEKDNLKAEQEALKQELEEKTAAQKEKEKKEAEAISKYKESLKGEILTSGTSGTYFAPLQNGSTGGYTSSLTGGCSNTSPVYHDTSASIGTPVYAPYDGTAKYIQSSCNGMLYSYGNQVRVYKDDGSGTYIIYAHFSKFPDGVNMPITKDCPYKNSSDSSCGAGHCSVGMTSTQVAEVSVKKGQLIGYTGTTGNSLGPHLHVEIHENGSSTCVVDPWAAFGMH